MSHEDLKMILIFSIPMLAIVTGFLKQWVMMRAQQRTLGTSNRELEKKIERLEQANAEYAQRFENLEAIVVSQTWSAVAEPGLPEADRQRRLAAATRQEPHAPAAEELNRQRAAELARRLG